MASESGAAHSDALDPIHQFEIKRLIPMEIVGVDVSFTNSALFMVIAVAVITLFTVMSMSGRAMVPGRLQSITELVYEFIAKMVRDNVGTDGMRFFPFVFSLFTFVLLLNMMGMIPVAFTVTSHIAITAALALLVVGTVIVYGFFRHGIGFLKLFAPDVPPALLPILTPIEIISFLSRPISLSVRLFANMLAGHITLKVFAGFVVSLGSLGAIGIVGAVLPLFMTVALTALEFLVAFLQAFIFATLTCIYLHDALHPHH